MYVDNALNPFLRRPIKMDVWGHEGERKELDSNEVTTRIVKSLILSDIVVIASLQTTEMLPVGTHGYLIK